MKIKSIFFLMLLSSLSFLIVGCSKPEVKEETKKWYEDCNSQAMKEAYKVGYKNVVKLASKDFEVQRVEINSAAATLAEKPYYSCKVNLIFDVKGYGSGTVDLTLNVENVRENGEIDFNCIASNEVFKKLP